MRCCSIGPAHMASRRNRPINLPAPYLKRVWLEPSRVTDREAYPFCLPLLRDDFELSFDKAITIIVGENGTGKSTLLEGIAVLAGYDEAGGGKGYMTGRPFRTRARKWAAQLSTALRASWLPEDHRRWLVLPRRELLLGRAISRRGRRRAGLPPTSSRIRMARGFCASSRSAASARASSFSTSRNPRCRPRARSSS